jgi:hypothetical protein
MILAPSFDPADYLRAVGEWLVGHERLTALLIALVLLLLIALTHYLLRTRRP